MATNHVFNEHSENYASMTLYLKVIYFYMIFFFIKNPKRFACCSPSCQLVPNCSDDAHICILILIIRFSPKRCLLSSFCSPSYYFSASFVWFSASSCLGCFSPLPLFHALLWLSTLPKPRCVYPGRTHQSQSLTQDPSSHIVAVGMLRY